MEISAPAHWRTVDFLSDLHLDRPDSPTLACFAHYLQHSPAQALMVLGDLFEAWVGDDALSQKDGVEQHVAALLCQAAQRMDIFIMCGNRDFLMGPALMHACGTRALADPSVLQFAGQRYLLTHGDALCLSDSDYLRFRQLSRSPAWQQDFLSKPLEERQALGQGANAEAGQHALLRLEMAAEVPTPAEHMDARRAMQLQLLTRRNDPSPQQTWTQDVAGVLATAYAPDRARRLQTSLKALLKR
jgi:UDP-2,3-diacylglucosamine hydrolase